VSTKTIGLIQIGLLLAVVPPAAGDQPSTAPADSTGQIWVATCQFPVSGDIKDNAQWIRRQMRQARKQNADLAHFCECALSGYVGPDCKSLDNFDWKLLRKETKSILDLAKELKLWVVLGTIHQLTGQHKPHNSLYLINKQGKIVDRYDKRFCTEGDLRHFSPGDHFVTFQINGVKCGLLICYDLGFPELYRQYYKLGTQAMFHSFYNARNTKRAARHAEFAPLLGRARATINHMYVSMSNSCAQHGWPNYFVNPQGNIVKKLEKEKPGIMVNLVDVKKSGPHKNRKHTMKAINGTLNSGKTIKDPRSEDRTCY
jgi:predicted amidohydrolase